MFDELQFYGVVSAGGVLFVILVVLLAIYLWKRYQNSKIIIGPNGVVNPNSQPNTQHVQNPNTQNDSNVGQQPYTHNDSDEGQQQPQFIYKNVNYTEIHQETYDVKKRVEANIQSCKEKYTQLIGLVTNVIATFSSIRDSKELIWNILPKDPSASMNVKQGHNALKELEPLEAQAKNFLSNSTSIRTTITNWWKTINQVSVKYSNLNKVPIDDLRSLNEQLNELLEETLNQERKLELMCGTIETINTTLTQYAQNISHDMRLIVKSSQPTHGEL